MTENKDVTDRLKREGQLTRNSGKNSIRSINIRLDKFQDVFDVMNEHLSSQTALLQKTLDLQIDETARKQRTEELESVSPSIDTGIQQQGMGGVVDPQSIQQDADIQQKGRQATLGLTRGMIAGISAISAGLGTMLANRVGPATIGRSLMRGGIIGILAPWISEFIADFTETALNNLGTDEMFGEGISKGIGENVSAIGMGALIGSIIGRRTAVVFGAANFARQHGDKIMDYMGWDDDDFIELFGKELGKENVADLIATAMGGAVALTLLRPGLFRGAALAAVGTAKAIGFSAMLTTAALSGLLIFGDEIADWLENKGTPRSFADLLVSGGTGAAAAGVAMSVAKFLGLWSPQGWIVRAGIMVGVGLGNVIYNWYKDQKGKAEEIARKQLEELDASKAMESLTSKDGMGGMSGIRELIPQVGSLHGSEVSDRLAHRMADLPSQELIEGFREAPSLTMIHALDDRMFSLRAKAEEAHEAGDDEKAALAIKEMQLTREALTTLSEDLREGVNIGGHLESGTMNELSEDVDAIIRNLDWQADRSDILSFRKGTKGFQDFGMGKLSILHGEEAVVPRETAAGQFLENNFTNEWKPKIDPVINMTAERLQTVSRSATERASQIFVNHSPVNYSPVVVRGGTTVNSSNRRVSVNSGDNSGLPGSAL